MPPPPRTDGFRPILRLPAFRLIWLSQLLALTAQNGIHFVQLVLIERLTGKSAHIGLMIVAFSLPPVLLSFFSAAVIDRVPKKWIISLSNITRALLAFAYLLVLQWLHGDALLIAVYLITFIASAIGVFNNPAVMAKIPLVVGEERLMTANSIFNITIAASQIVGLIFLAPLAVKAVGVSGAFVLMGLCYLFAFFLDLLLPRDPGRRVKGVTMLASRREVQAELHEGWRFVAREGTVGLAMLQLTLVATLVMILAMIAPGFSARVLGLAPEDAVFVFAPAGLGMFIAMIFLGRWGSRLSQQWLQLTMLLFTGSSFAFMGFLSRDYSTLRIPIFDVYPERLVPLTVMVSATALVAGFAIYGVLTIAQTAIQRQTPANLRGRVFTVQFMLTNLIGMIPLLAAAWMADLLGIPEMMRWLAISCAVVSAISLLALRRPSPAPSP
ncbi:MAG: MFS transporter [Caldilineales bacterium]|nr:MFS transporter [Caldilineales bacterium]